MIRLLVVDDHAIVREGVRRLLEDAKDPIEVREAGTAAEALAEVEARDFDVVLLDIALPGRDGVDVLRHLRAQRRSPPVLIFSMYPEEQYGVRMLRAGAAGYLCKDRVTEELLAAVRKVARGGRYVTETVAERLALAVDQSTTDPPHAALSEREEQVTRALASGLTVGQIAERLALSVKTVSTYRTRALEKLGLASTAELVGYALRAGLVD